MPTIKDIAREAGVSHGTVSNVLNKTGKVSAEKIQLVESAAKRLGYKVNIQAQLLRQGTTKSICVILPNLNARHYIDLFTNIRQEFTTSNYETALYTTEGIPILEQEIWDQVLSGRPDAIICASCLEHFPDHYFSDCPVVLVDQVPDSDSAPYFSASFDFVAAGKEIAAFINSSNRPYKKAAFFSESGKAASKTNLYQSIADALSPHIEFTRFSSDDKLMMSKAFDVIQGTESFDVVVTSNIERAESITKALSYCSKEQAPDLITLASMDTFPDPRYTCYELNYKHMGQEIAIQLAQYLSDRKLPHFDCKNHGFRFTFPHLKKATQVATLNMLTLESPSSVALKMLLPDFEKKTGIQVHVTVLSFDELYDTISTMGNSGYYDLIRMDMAWLSHLGAGTYLPLSEIQEDLTPILDQMIPEIDDSYLMAGGVHCTLPFDPSTQMLFYRKDLFEDAMIKRQYYERYREELNVPTSFGQYNRIASFFTRELNPSSPVSYGATMTFGSSGVAACDYIPRLSAFPSPFFDAEGKLYLNSPEALEALHHYIETYSYTDRSINMWWKQSVENFAKGNTSMTIVFMNHASDLINSKHSQIVGKIGYAVIPGGRPLLGGGVIGISKGSRHVAPCHEFFKWVYSDEIANALTLLGGLSPNRSIYENRDITNLFPWLEACQTSFSYGTRRIEHTGYQNFSEKRFETILGVAVRSATTGIVSAKEALDYAQAQAEQTFY